MSKTLQLGEMEFTNEIRVSDPCYDKNTWCTKLITTARPGIWKGYALKGKEEEWGERIQHIAIVHESVNYSDYVNSEGRILFDKLKCLEGVDIGVDSGQAGFFREDCFGQGKNEAWYDAVCECSHQEVPPIKERDFKEYCRLQALVLGKDRQDKAWEEFYQYDRDSRGYSESSAAIFTYQGQDQGFNSSSGFGDGGYNLGVHEVDDQIVAMFVPFTYGP